MVTENAQGYRVASVTLAGRPFRAAQPVFRTLKKILPLYQSVGPRVVTGEVDEALFDAMLSIVFLAIQSEHPDVTRDALEDLRITAQELDAALATIAELSGIKRAEGDDPNAQAATAGTGTTSIPG